jgi:transcriptional regulator with XRE-family HTH domain
MGADRIREILKRMGMSQRQAARELEISDRQVRYWAAGAEPVPRWFWLALERLEQLNEI